MESSRAAGVGSLVLASLFAALIGVFAGVITTFTHRQAPPLGLLAGLVIVALVLSGFRLVFDSRVVAGAAALGILGASALLSLPGAGGSVLVVDGALGYAWAFGPTVIAALVLAWPRARTAPSA